MSRDRGVTVRCHKDLRDIINYVRAKYIMNGKKPPECSKITKIIARKLNKENILNEVMVEI